MTSSKRFAFIISDFYGGGAQKVLLNTAEGLRLRGNDVKVFTLRERVEHHIPPDLNVVNLGVINKLTKAFSNVFIEKLQALFIKKELDKYCPDVVVSCSCDKITRHLTGYNIYFWVHSNSLDSSLDKKKVKKEISKIRKHYLGRKVIAVSSGIKDALVLRAGLEENDVSVIYNPFNQSLIREKAKESLCDLSFEEYFIFVGTFERRKRHDRLLNAYYNSGVKTPLVILGKGKPEEEKSIKNLINKLGLDDRVKLIGYHENPYPFIKKAKSLILTSDQEGLPTVLIEALFLHTPVISVDCPSGPREILKGNLKKFLVPLNDESALSEAIREMDDSPLEINVDNYREFSEDAVLPKFEEL